MRSSRLLLWVAGAGAAVAIVAGLGATRGPDLIQAANAQSAEPGKKLEKDLLAAAEFAARGAESCLRCHDKAPATLILHTAHAVKADARTPFAAHACESCHGASPEHMQRPREEAGPRPPPAVSFGKKSKNTVAEQNEVCLTCHTGGNRMNWKGSPHHVSDTSCVSCHDLHTTNDRVASRKTQPFVCFDCHKEQRAQAQRRSHHPIIEGLVTCSECHNPHGSPTDKLLVGMTLNDTCYGCHAEKRGPFLWEHAPVREDCSYCHVPHGAVQPRLLKARAPYLCQECHSVQQHPGNLYPSATQPPTAGHQFFAKACLNCHSQVHGSNHPSGVRNMR